MKDTTSDTLGEGCSHVAVIMFKVEARVRLGYTSCIHSCQGGTTVGVSYHNLGSEMSLLGSEEYKFFNGIMNKTQKHKLITLTFLITSLNGFCCIPM